MKKIYIILAVLCLIWMNKSKVDITIPADAIRFRIIASSNTLEDQMLKTTIKKDLMKNIMPTLSQANTKQEAEALIISNVSNIENTLKKYDVSYDISFGQNTFPQKYYKGISYPEGIYESLVITLGGGSGDNWWCVLYPPLCMLETKEDASNAEYRSFIKDILVKHKS